MILTILLFITILAILILVHEFGHFFAAKKSGAKVEEFGIGFPPRVFSIKKGETIYSINLFPIGGFVKIYGEDGPPDDAKRDDPRSFTSKSIGIRTLIIVAGVLMNILLAVALFSLSHFMGMPQALGEGESVPRSGIWQSQGNIENISVRITDISEGSPAELAGIQVGDIILGMSRGEDKISNIQNASEVQNFTDRFRGEKILLTLKSGGDVLEKEVIPRVDPPKGAGAIGFAMIKTGEISYPLYIAPFKGIESTYLVTVATLKAFGGIISDFVTTGTLRGELAGPIGIAVITGQVQKMGFVFLLQFMALISINLAIINVLPFPALDGGRLLFIVIEKIKGSPVNQKIEKMAHMVGFALLMLLMIAITLRDIGRYL